MIIPLQPLPNQTLTIDLSGQRTRLTVYEKHIQEDPGITPSPSPAIFVDIFLNDAPVLLGVPALVRHPIVLDPYLGFIGEFFFFDMQEQEEDPEAAGLGDRWVMTYYAP